MEEIYLKKHEKETYFFFRKVKEYNKENYIKWITLCNKKIEEMKELNKNDTFKKFLNFLQLSESEKETINYSNNTILTIWKNKNYQLTKIEIKGKKVMTGNNTYYTLSKNN